MEYEDKQQRRDKWRTIVDEYLQSGISQKHLVSNAGLACHS